MSTYIYGLFCPLARTIRYIGKSIEPLNRFRTHLNFAPSGKHHTARWLNKLLSAGLEPELIILYEVKPNEDWREIERAYIASGERNGWKLTNSTAGGDGLDFISPEVEKRRRENLKKAQNRKDVKYKISTKAKARWSDPKFREKNIAALNDPEVKARQKISRIAVWADPVVGARLRAANNTEEVRIKRIAAQKAVWSDPGKRAKMLAANRTDEQRMERSERARRNNQTPEYRSMMAHKMKEVWASGQRGQGRKVK